MTWKCSLFTVHTGTTSRRTSVGMHTTCSLPPKQFLLGLAESHGVTRGWRSGKGLVALTSFVSNGTMILPRQFLWLKGANHSRISSLDKPYGSRPVG